MSRWYLDTSAALKLLVAEAESDPLDAALESARPELLSCYLLETEVRRAVWRIEELNQEDASALLAGVDLYEVPPSLFREAGLIASPPLRALDSIHLAAAIRLDVDALVAYDERLLAAARQAGIDTLSPGRQ